MAARPQKPVSQLQDRSNPRAQRGVLVLVPDSSAGRRVLPMPRGLQPGAKRRWQGLWKTTVSQMIDVDADAEAVYRWIHCVSERERLQVLADKRPTVLGSVGQETANPLYGVIAAYSREIARAEDHLGLTPVARMRLGVVIGQAADSLAGMRQRLDPAPKTDNGIIDLEELG